MKENTSRILSALEGPSKDGLWCAVHKTLYAEPNPLDD
jgi:hypothetical protein